MSFQGANTGHQAMPTTPLFTFGPPQHPNGQTTTVPAGFKFAAPEPMAPPRFSFCCSPPSFGAQVNTSSTSFPCEASSRFSFGTTDTSTPLATLFGGTATTANAGFMFGEQSSATSTFPFRTGTDTITTSAAEFKFESGIATTRSARFGFGTTTATTTNANGGFCFGNAASTNSGFSFRPLQCERMVATLGQTNANTTCGFTFSTANSASNASTGLAFRDAQEFNNFGRFCGARTTTVPILSNTFTPTTSSAISAATGFANTTSVPSLKFGVTTSYVPSGTASFANVASGFSTEAHQPSGFHLDAPNSVPFQSAFTTFQFPNAKSPATSNFGTNSISLSQPGVSDGFNASSHTGMFKLDASTRIDTTNCPVTRNQCIVCMKECESKSSEELRLEYYGSNRKGGGTATTSSIKSCAPNLTFFSATQFPLGSTGIMNSTFGSTGLFGQTPKNQTTNIALAHSNGGDTANCPKQTENIPKSISGNPKLGSVLNDSSNGARTLIAILSQHLGMLEAITGKSFALDSLIALMIISRMISIQEILSMIPGNIGVNDLKTHLIRATNEFNSQVLSEIFEEEAGETCGKIKQELDISHDDAHLAGETKPIRLSLAEKLPADTSCKVFHIQVRLPNGEIVSLNLMSDTPLSILFACIASHGYPVAEYRVLACYPFRDLTALKESITLEGSNLYPREILMVEKR